MAFPKYEYKGLGTLTYKNVNDKFYWMHARLRALEGVNGPDGPLTFQSVTNNGNTTTNDFYLVDSQGDTLLEFQNESGMGVFRAQDRNSFAETTIIPEELTIKNGEGNGVSDRVDFLDDSYVQQRPKHNGFLAAKLNGVPADEFGNLTLNDASGSQINSGAIISWLSDFDYAVSAATYSIAGTPYSYAGTSLVSLSPADPDNARIDLFVLDINEDLVIIEGTPADAPVSPNYDPSTQILIGFAYIDAAATAPNIIEEVVYRENTEWTTFANVPQIDVASTSSPISGSVSVEAVAAQASAFVEFSTSLFFLSTFNVLTFNIKPTIAWGTNNNIFLQFYNNGAALGSQVFLSSGNFGFDGNNIASQIVSIPISLFSIPLSQQINKLRISTNPTSGQTMDFLIDDIRLQFVESVSTINPFWSPIGNSIYNNNTGSVGIGGIPNTAYKGDFKGGHYRIGTNQNETLTLGNGMIFNMNGIISRLFSGRGIQYQSNATSGIQHDFKNQIGNSFTGILAQFGLGYYSNSLSVLSVLGNFSKNALNVSPEGTVGYGPNLGTWDPKSCIDIRWKDKYITLPAMAGIQLRTFNRYLSGVSIVSGGQYTVPPILTLPSNVGLTDCILSPIMSGTTITGVNIINAGSGLYYGGGYPITITRSPGDTGVVDADIQSVFSFYSIAEGAMVFHTEFDCICIYDGSQWQYVKGDKTVHVDYNEFGTSYTVGTESVIILESLAGYSSVVGPPYYFYLDFSAAPAWDGKMITIVNKNSDPDRGYSCSIQFTNIDGSPLDVITPRTIVTLMFDESSGNWILCNKHNHNGYP